MVLRLKQIKIAGGVCTLFVMATCVYVMFVVEPKAIADELFIKDLIDTVAYADRQYGCIDSHIGFSNCIRQSFNGRKDDCHVVHLEDARRVETPVLRCGESIWFAADRDAASAYLVFSCVRWNVYMPTERRLLAVHSGDRDVYRCDVASNADIEGIIATTLREHEWGQPFRPSAVQWKNVYSIDEKTVVTMKSR